MGVCVYKPRQQESDGSILMTQTERIYKLLKKRPKSGVTNYELNKIAFRYAARIHEMRKDGLPISIIHVKDSLWIYKLEKENT